MMPVCLSSVSSPSLSLGWELLHYGLQRIFEINREIKERGKIRTKEFTQGNAKEEEAVDKVGGG